MDSKSRALEILRASNRYDIIQWEGGVLTLHRTDGQLLTMKLTQCYFYSRRNPDTMVTVEARSEGGFSIVHDGSLLQAKYGRIYTNPGYGQLLTSLLNDVRRPKFV